MTQPGNELGTLPKCAHAHEPSSGPFPDGQIRIAAQQQESFLAIKLLQTPPRISTYLQHQRSEENWKRKDSFFRPKNVLSIFRNIKKIIVFLNQQSSS